MGEMFSFFKKKEEKVETPAETPVISEAEQGKEELGAAFDLRIGMLKREIENMNDGSTMAGVDEDLEKIGNVIKELKESNGSELLEKLTWTLTGLRESINKNPSPKKEEAYARVKEFIVNGSLNK
jgi:hypothetical protein